MKIKTLTILFIILNLYSCANKKTENHNAAQLKQMSNQKEILYVGTYTRKEGHVDGKADGIYVYSFDSSTGELSKLHTTAGIINPSYLTIHPDKRHLYAVSEIVGNDSIDGGLVYSYDINQEDYSLRFLNAVQSQGGAPCYVSVHPEGDHVMVANYVGGNVSVFPTQETGALKEASSVVQHEGKGSTDRQEAPHAHMITSYRDQIFAADLGLDKVYLYELNKENGKLNTNGNAKVDDGSGPRHIAFHPSENRMYVLNELNGTITAFQINQDSLKNIQNISTLKKEGIDAGSADIHITPDGRYLYASNRSENNDIAMYSIDEKSGKLELIGHQTTFGKTPRNFVIDPSGNFLLVANQDSGNVVVFKIDYKTGKLIDTGVNTSIPTPVCLKFL